MSGKCSPCVDPCTTPRRPNAWTMKGTGVGAQNWSPVPGTDAGPVVVRPVGCSAPAGRIFFCPGGKGLMASDEFIEAFDGVAVLPGPGPWYYLYDVATSVALRMQTIDARGMTGAQLELLKGWNQSGRDQEFMSARMGRSFILTPQSQAGVLGTTTFVATGTSPFLLLSNSGASTCKKLSIRRLVLWQSGTVAAGNIQIAVSVDTRDRYTSGGTDVLASCANPNVDTGTYGAGGRTTALTNARVSGSAIVATADGALANTRYVTNALLSAAVPSAPLEIDFGDRLIIGTTGSFLVYAWSAVTGPTLLYSVEYAEID